MDAIIGSDMVKSSRSTGPLRHLVFSDSFLHKTLLFLDKKTREAIRFPVFLLLIEKMYKNLHYKYSVIQPCCQVKK